MKHFLEISQLSYPQIHSLLARACEFKQSGQFPCYSRYTMATLFYEKSTRTRISFELAAKKLSMNVIHVDLPNSSEAKGEIVQDTINTLGAMGINVLTIRHRQEGLPRQLAEKLPDSVHIINAGDGQHAHPSQAMLDFLTIIEKKPDLNHLKVAIVGDIRHSRVANSMQCLCATLKVGELALVAPQVWQPRQIHYGWVTDSLPEGLSGADVVIALRVQHERLLEKEQMDKATYRKLYALTADSIKFAKPDAMIMHPGPINRGVEIDSEIADGNQSFILEQVKNGVFMRMAILESLVQAG